MIYSCWQMGKNCMNNMCILSHNHKWNLMTIQNVSVWVSFECNVLENWPNDFIYRCFLLESVCRNSRKIAQQQHQHQQKQHTGSFNWNTMDLNDCNLQLRNRMETNVAYKLQLYITCINLNSLIRAGCSTHWMDPCQENPLTVRACLCICASVYAGWYDLKNYIP